MGEEDKHKDSSSNAENSSSGNYKVKSLKLFSEFETFESGFKYRKVFDSKTTDVIFSELVLQNKLFDIEDWIFEYSIKILNSDNRCIVKKDLSRTISSDNNISFVVDPFHSEGDKMLLEKDEYRLQIISEANVLKECSFYIDDFGDSDPYSFLDFDYARLNGSSLISYIFSGMPEGISPDKYLKKFNISSLRSITLELSLNVTERNRFWPCEIDIILKKESGEVKERFKRLIFVYPSMDNVNINIDFDNSQSSFFRLGKYFAEIHFMNTLMACIQFEIGNKDVESHSWEHKIPFMKKKEKPERLSPALSKDHLSEINELIAMHDVKERLKKQSHYIKYLRLRSQFDSHEKKHIPMHSVFLGNPGTGKTTVARMLGKIYKEAGFLSSGHVIETSRENLVAEYIGQTAQKTRRVIDSAKGGILFIDEAYSLTRQNADKQDFGTEVIEVLIKEIDTNEDIIIIAAGYTEEMKIFIDSNNGLRSRFTNMFEFPDYTPDELWEILEYVADKRGLKIGEEVKDIVYPYLVESYRNRGSDFGNARLVCELLEKAEMNLAVRSVENETSLESAEDLVILQADDFRSIIDEEKTNSFHIPVNETELESDLKELESLIGLSNIKKEINDTVNLIKYFKSEQRDRLDSLSFNFIFTGNPGTGKTTVARILAKILKSSGILERGHLIECDRRGLVGTVIGETAMKTGELIKRAEGGILYIDEAYSLSNGGNFDYGREAVEVLIKEMEDSRGRFSVICSGYTNNMKEFLESNPGFLSRIDRTFHFSDYTEYEIYEIAVSMLRSKKLEVTKTADKYIRELIGRQYIRQSEYGYGNAREIRKLVELIERKHFLIVSRLTDLGERSSRSGIIDIEDLGDIDFDAGGNFLVEEGE